MNKNIVLIQSHCNSQEKKEILLENIKKLKKFELDILLYSHIPLSEEITSQVDYFIFDKTNPVMWDERRHYYWWSCNEYKLESTVPDYGWTVFNQLIGSENFIKNKNYENVIIFCYDLIIDEVVTQFLVNPKPQIFQHCKKQENDSETILGTALVFSIFEKNKFSELVSLFSRKEYVENYGWIAEKYFEIKLNILNLQSNSKLTVYDKISESKNIFNISNKDYYDLFIDNQNLLKFIFKNKTQEFQKLIINDELISVKPGTYFFNNEITKIDTFGLLYDDKFECWKHFLKELKKNQITFY